jgi:hypothetical protein
LSDEKGRLNILAQHFPLNPAVRTRKLEAFAMHQRRRSPPHSFENQLAAEKACLRTQLTKAPRGPERDALGKKIRQLIPHCTSTNGFPRQGFSRHADERPSGTGRKTAQDAAECALIRDLATDKAKGERFDRLTNRQRPWQIKLKWR